MLSDRETYISVDIEADGPIPGPYSMLSLGAAAYAASGDLTGTFEANLEPLEGAAVHPDTQAWWERQPVDIYDAARTGAQPAESVMRRFDTWVRQHPGLPVMVGYPATYDFMFVHWYLVRFTGGSPFSHSALDLKTLGMQRLDCGFRKVNKRELRRRFPTDLPHTHRAVDDAIEQGDLLFQLARARRR